MIAYLDSSVVLRVVLQERSALKEWRRIRTGVVSALVEVECLRTLDTLRLRGSLDDERLAERRGALFAFLAKQDVVEVSRVVLDRAGQPMPVPLRTLDAIHLATALLWREDESPDIVMATHDGSLGLAAGAFGMKVIGV